MSKHDQDTNELDRSNFVLGRERFSRISAVEGIALSSPMKQRIKKFDEQGLSDDERRSAIIAVHLKT